MDWLNEFEDHISLLFAEAEAKILRFPPPLDQFGLQYLSGFDNRNTASTKNYICYLLPFWLERAWINDLLPSARDRLQHSAKLASLANIMGMLHFFIQDDLMDHTLSAETDADHRLERQVLIPLSQLFHSEFLLLMAEASEHKTQVWHDYRQFTAQWANSVYHEPHANYFMEAREQIAAKASPLKLSAAVMLMQADISSHLPELLSQLDDVLIVLQMNDDAADWQEDFQNHNYNCLLSLIRHMYTSTNSYSHTPLQTPFLLNEQLVHQAIYDHRILNRYASIASEISHVSSVSPISSHLTQFHNYLIQQLHNLAEQVDKQRTDLLQHGSILYYSRYKK